MSEVLTVRVELYVRLSVIEQSHSTPVKVVTNNGHIQPNKSEKHHTTQLFRILFWLKCYTQDVLRQLALSKQW
jgi:hypothetical protein